MDERAARPPIKGGPTLAAVEPRALWTGGVGPAFMPGWDWPSWPAWGRPLWPAGARGSVISRGQRMSHLRFDERRRLEQLLQIHAGLNAEAVEHVNEILGRE